MIAHLTGKLLEKQATSVIIQVGGVGYEVTIPVSTFYDLAEVGGDVSLRIYTHVREDALQLFGFKTAQERELFLQLISVSGVGPKLGITIMSGMNADEMVTAIRSNNLARLTAIPGIGKKTAERLVIELRDKVNALPAAEGEAVAAVAGANGSAPSHQGVLDDTLSVLLNLGYQRAAAEKALNTASREDIEFTVNAMIRRCLQLLAKG
ncbi:MAG: Holliday junction branch migration protein RuvA [Pyrinomonadaceae bacterium]